MSAAKMVFLGFGKYARADKIYALEPITGEERGHGKRTLVWVDGIPDPIVASRTEQTILEDMAEATAVVAEVRRRRGRAAAQHPQLFDE
jgi:hypothetical protein